MVDCVASNRLLSLGRATVLLSYYYRKAIQDYCSANNRTVLTDALMNLVRRIEANSFAIKELVKVSIKNDGTQYFKLSIGLLLRSCLMDSIIGLYLSTQDKESALKIIRNTEHDYVKALPDRFEVYADRDGLSGMDESLLKHIYGLQIEDHFPHQIDWENIKSDEDKNRGFFSIEKSKNLTVKSAFDQLKSDSQHTKLSKKLYAYYKEYSQYEHYSLYGHSDSLTPYDKDSTSMSKAFLYICEAMHYMLGSVDVGLRLNLSSYSSLCYDKMMEASFVFRWEDKFRAENEEYQTVDLL